MKKILIFFLLILILSGCTGNKTTPKGEVQKLFSNYTNLSSDVLIQLDSVMESEDLTQEQKTKYKDVLKRQYEDLKYKINDEIIDADKAIVSTSIEVYNLSKVIEESEKYLDENKDEFYIEETYINNKFWDYKLDKMYKTSERITYTIDFTLTRIDGKWHLDELLETDRQKIHGLYR